MNGTGIGTVVRAPLGKEHSDRMRNTRQKDVIRESLKGGDGFVSARQLHEKLEEAGEHIALATVYRQLNAMEEQGLVDTVRMNGQQLFRLCGDDRHHHHLVCVSCGRTVQIDPPSEQWLRKVADTYDFTIESHTLEVFGLCAECREREGRDAEAADTGTTGTDAD